ncbi:DEAD/DEAH box helicase [Desulfosediminicola flagellatus]|uniref:DEAD/DEAH box helicase n=1 Tax=Desulfosediminicola flagellatus TaxID=2569541 RepID=UPI0010ABABE2|nr:DEAD/DEAH box helicase [Desulfosediminicola flagellatus]
MSNDFLTVMPQTFSDLGLIEPLLKSLEKSGYTEPTPIQAKMIPHVMAGQDVVGQAQTGTGKTAAFALPLLNQLRPNKKARPTVLVLTPTRELAIQVCEAFKTYGANMSHLRVLPIFGGQDYSGQLQALERGVHIVVGTPGRVMDHMRRGSLNLSTIQTLVLDEADEMLKMGFLDDVEWILEQAPKERQIALFSATMPSSIRKIAGTYLNEPVEITIKSKTVTASTITQSFITTSGFNAKRVALARILEAEDFDGMLIFVRTKIQTVELAEYISELGYSCSALNGDMVQNQRLRTVEQLKAGKLDILIATDVAARGLDVERVSHVLNFDIPFDTEAYIHRIGRTGRAGRTGQAILFLTPRERSMLKAIERATKQKIDSMQLPSISAINTKRIAKYKNQITETLATDCSFFTKLIEEFCQENDTPPEVVAAALAKMAQGKTPLLLKEEPRKEFSRDRDQRRTRNDDTRKNTRERSPRKPRPVAGPVEDGMDRYRIELGEAHGVKPGNIVGAIANEADISSDYIGRIAIFDDYSTVDLPYGMPNEVLKLLQGVRINGRPMKAKKDDSPVATAPARPSGRSGKPGSGYGNGKNFKGSRRKTQTRNKSFAAPAAK